ncbi:hypothetical protein SpCBS45565_g07020 [Spizellomyces sp. 'palustris']|nr:hypothetical protein SpCBS45565_g07020 [Spizellomyces sp. 'palustris']
MSPILQRKAPSTTTSDFEVDLLAYIKAYGHPLSVWHEKLSLYDFSTCNAVIIASVPGRHLGRDLRRWGHLRLRSVLEEVTIGEQCQSKSIVVGQFSSIGSLGTSDEWLTQEFGASLSTARNLAECRPPSIRLVFPTVENVRSSLEGWAAGNSIPFDSKNWAKQQHYMRPRMCIWRADAAGRDRAMPHIKTFTRLSEDGDIAWFLLTSANLSKAAWGSLEKNAKQLMIRSYELGVLVYPGLFKMPWISNTAMRNVSSEVAPFLDLTLKNKGPDNIQRPVIIPLRLPYDLPLTPYGPNDEAWTWDLKRTQLDSCGMTKE